MASEASDEAWTRPGAKDDDGWGFAVGTIKDGGCSISDSLDRLEKDVVNRETVVVPWELFVVVGFFVLNPRVGSIGFDKRPVVDVEEVDDVIDVAGLVVTLVDKELVCIVVDNIVVVVALAKVVVDDNVVLEDVVVDVVVLVIVVVDVVG